MGFYIVYATEPPTYSGYATEGEAVEQARHDRTQPGQATPASIVEVELPADAHRLGLPGGPTVTEEIEVQTADDAEPEIVTTVRLKSIHDVIAEGREVYGPEALDALDPHDCALCQWHLTKPEDRAEGDHPNFAGVRGG